MRPIACANSAARMKLMHRIYALAQPSNRHTNFDDVREVAHDGLDARSALVTCHDAFDRDVIAERVQPKGTASGEPGLGSYTSRESILG